MYASFVNNCRFKHLTCQPSAGISFKSDMQNIKETRHCSPLDKMNVSAR
jgi:hypothetical protein